MLQRSGMLKKVYQAALGLDRPEFKKMMDSVKKNDLIVVTALDRLGRDAEDILNTVSNCERLGVRICILALGRTERYKCHG